MLKTKDKGTALQVMQELSHLGYHSTFEVRDTLLWSIHADMTYAPYEVALEATFRYEGISNPEDLEILYVFRCADGTGGYIMDAYGPSAAPDVSSFFNLVQDKREKLPIMDALPATKELRISARPKTP